MIPDCEELEEDWWMRGQRAQRRRAWLRKQRILQNETLKRTQTPWEYNRTAQMLFLGDVMAIGVFKNLIQEQ